MKASDERSEATILNDVSVTRRVQRIVRVLLFAILALGGCTANGGKDLVGTSAQADSVTSELAVDCGGGGGAGAGAFASDQGYNGGLTASTSKSVVVSGIADAAPEEVYQTVRYGDFTYAFGSLKPGATYTVRLHFAEIYFDAAGKRVFNVLINDRIVISAYDIYAEVGALKATVKTFSATADSYGKIIVFFESLVDNANVNGIELIAESAAADAGTDAASSPDSGAPHADGGDAPPPDSGTSKKDAGSTSGRPSYNTGDGFFVKNGELYDANGNAFRMRGVDRCHYDSPSQPGIAKSGANAVRIFVPTLWGESVPGLVNIVQTQHIDENEVPLPTASYTTSGTSTSCNDETSVLSSVVDTWVSTASNWTPLNKYMIMNVANEWGPSNSTVWRDSYISAIASLRAAGYLGTILVDSGGCGQDMGDLLNYSTAVFNSDPQKNVMFALHVYGGTPTAAVANTNFAALAALSKSAGMVFAITEFGPGRNIGPSPTLLTPGEVITAAEANGLGWLGWAWDDNDLGDGKSDNNWFSMTLAGPGIYTQPSDLTTYGQDVVLNPTYGISVLAKPASIF